MATNTARRFRWALLLSSWAVVLLLWRTDSPARAAACFTPETQTVTVGDPATIDASGCSPTSSVVVAWGDGASSTLSASPWTATHSYASSGTATGSVTVDGTTAGNFTVTVDAATTTTSSSTTTTEAPTTTTSAPPSTTTTVALATEETAQSIDTHLTIGLGLLVFVGAAVMVNRLGR